MVQLIDTVFENVASAAQPADSDAKYSGYKVGYFGDYAGVSLKLAKPVKSESIQHLKYREVRKDVVTETEYKSPEQIKAMALSDAYGPEDSALLRAAHEELKQFIHLNGRYRPMSVLDLEGR